MQTRAHGGPVDARSRDGVVELRDSDRRVAPGQVVAIYDGDAVLGGGIAA